MYLIFSTFTWGSRMPRVRVFSYADNSALRLAVSRGYSEKLAGLKPAFAKDGTVTAGNASGVNDGAAALLLVEASRAEALGLTPLAFVGVSAAAGVAPSRMGIGPVPDQ